MIIEGAVYSNTRDLHGKESHSPAGISHQVELALRSFIVWNSFVTPSVTFRLSLKPSSALPVRPVNGFCCSFSEP